MEACTLGPNNWEPQLLLYCDKTPRPTQFIEEGIYWSLQFQREFITIMEGNMALGRQA